MRERGRCLLLAAVVCAVASGCTSASTPTTQPIEWAHRAQQYFTAFHEAQAVGFTNLGPFFTP